MLLTSCSQADKNAPNIDSAADKWALVGGISADAYVGYIHPLLKDYGIPSCQGFEKTLGLVDLWVPPNEVGRARQLLAADSKEFGYKVFFPTETPAADR
jgi:hypothetical protein